MSVELPDRTEIVRDPDSLHLAFNQLESPARITGPNGSFTRFVICLPGGVEKEYYGRLEVRRHYYFLQMVVEMDREFAVASVLAAEGANVLPREALRAQAVVARSYMLAIGGRHDGFDLCDTTHCQLLANPPGPNSEAVRAAFDTRGQVLTFRNKIVPAMYSQDCGGRTKAFGSGVNGPGAHDYSFPSVECSRRGHASGHGVGLCQLGALSMARSGATAEQILAHYFPGTVLALPNGARRPLLTVPTSLHDHQDIGKPQSRQSSAVPRASLSVDTDGRGVSLVLDKFVPPTLRALVHAAVS
jgi:Stage II sporulation protein